MIYDSNIAGDRQLLQAGFNKSRPRKVECCEPKSEGCQVQCQEEEQASIEDPWQEVSIFTQLYIHFAAIFVVSDAFFILVLFRISLSFMVSSLFFRL